MKATRHDQTGRHLTEAQRTALEALLDGATVTEAALVAGVTRQTVSEWKNHEPAFVEVLRQETRDRLATAHSGILGLVPQAVATLRDDLDAGGERVSSAAHAILGVIEQLGPVDTSAAAPVDDHPWPELRDLVLKQMEQWDSEDSRAG
jgi:hypothetical protein